MRGSLTIADDKPRKTGRNARDALAVFSATVVALGIGFVTSVVVARLLGPEGRGLLGVASAVSAIAVAVASLGLPIAIVYYASRRPRLMPDLLGSALAFGVVLLVVLLGLALLVSNSDLSWLRQTGETEFWGLVALLTWVTYLEFVSVNVLRARTLYDRTNALLVVSRTTVLVLTVLLVALLDLGTNGALLALIAGSVLYSLGALPTFVRRGVGVSRNVFAAMVRYGWRVQIGRVIQIGNGRLDVLILSALAPLATVGVYVVAQVVAELVTLVPAAIGFVAMPAIAQGRTASPDVCRTVRLSGSLSLVGMLGVAIVGPALIYYGYGSEFSGALWPLFILLPGVWLFGIGSVVADVLRALGRPGTPSVLAAVAIVVTVALDLLLIPRFAAVGAAVASTCAYAVYGLASAVVLSRIEGVGIGSLLVANRAETRVLWQSMSRKVMRRRRTDISEHEG